MSCEPTPAARLWPLAIVALAGCPRLVGPERQAVEYEAGIAVPFSAEGERTWDFGDGSPRESGRQVRHAFERRGRYRVQSFDGSTLAETWELTVVPRTAFHAVAADAEAAIVARTFDDFAPAIDFSERLVGAATTQTWLEGLPALAFALDQGSGTDSVLDSAEGLGVFTWPDADVVVSFAGIVSPARAIEAFDAFLRANGWEPQGQSEPRRYARGPISLVALVDRGVLYGFSRTGADIPVSALRRVTTGSARGLATAPALAVPLSEVARGGVALISRPGAAMPWSAFGASVRFDGDQVVLSGRLWAKGPLWKRLPDRSRRLLESVSPGVLAAASASVPAERVASALFGPPQSRPRVSAARALREVGVDLDALAGALTGDLDAVAYLDASAFIRAVIETDGRPSPRGTLLAQLELRDRNPVGPAVDAAFSELGLEFLKDEVPPVTRWRSVWREQPVVAELAARSLSLVAGRSLPAVDPASRVNLAGLLGRRFGGAFGPGHVSVFLDVGHMRRELAVPRQLEGLDARRVMGAQALTLAFLEQVTQLEELLLDVAPDERGAVVQGLVLLKKRPGRQP